MKFEANVTYIVVPQIIMSVL